MTPNEQIAVIRARAEGKRIEGRHNSYQPWVELLADTDFNFALFDYRIAPSPIASGHNPDKLTVEQVGEGWRLLSEEEIDPTRRKTIEVQMWSSDAMTWHPSGWFADHPTRTYRTQKPEGYFLPKKTVKVEGWMNVYRNGRGYLYPSKENADALTTSSRIACKHIVFEVEEGEGL